jgi:hypothetical protein
LAREISEVINVIVGVTDADVPIFLMRQMMIQRTMKNKRRQRYSTIPPK